jgi:hypothetical protein
MQQSNMPLVPRPGKPSIRLCVNTALNRLCERGQACTYSYAQKADRPCKYWHGKEKCAKGPDCLMGHEEAVESWERCRPGRKATQNGTQAQANDPMHEDGKGPPAVQPNAAASLGAVASTKDYQLQRAVVRNSQTLSSIQQGLLDELKKTREAFGQLQGLVVSLQHEVQAQKNELALIRRWLSWHCKPSQCRKKFP